MEKSFFTREEIREESRVEKCTQLRLSTHFADMPDNNWTKYHNSQILIETKLVHTLSQSSLRIRGNNIKKRRPVSNG